MTSCCCRCIMALKGHRKPARVRSMSGHASGSSACNTDAAGCTTLLGSSPETNKLRAGHISYLPSSPPHTHLVLSLHQCGCALTCRKFTCIASQVSTIEMHSWM
jgi:hypothetical protein